jgi:formylglycine-generating enzyme required for sulfatase activity
MLEGEGEEGADEDVLAKGTSVGRYTVLERLGAGGMGVVYAAYDPELDRKIALKFLRAQEGSEADRAHRQERLVREAKAIAKLSHPNVVGIFDVGVHEGRVFLAMEYLGGGTLRDWMNAEKRPWREIVKMFIQVGQGLAAAHAEGLIHRDFKPDNVLIDKAGKPKVADFGLVRLGSTAGDASAPVGEEAPPEISQAAPVPLTRTGALAGTPAYMAPEQFLGRPIDARTDQFAFCVALYEALHGERPFAGDTVMELAGAVSTERLRPLPKNVELPTWIRNAVVKGLRTDPLGRHHDVDELLAVLALDPGARRRRRLLVAAASLLAIGGGLAIRQAYSSKHKEIERKVAEHVGAADVALATAAAKRAESRTLRAQAFAAFDGFEREKGETLWTRALAAAKAADHGYQRGIQRLEAAVTLATRRDELKDRIADALVDYLEMEGRSAAEREAGLRQLVAHDAGGARSRRLTAPAIVRIATRPAGLATRIESYDPQSFQPAEAPREVGRTPLELSLPPGSYRLAFEGTSTHADFQHPILLAAGERRDETLDVPLRSSVPKDFVYVPAGRSLFGSANEDFRAVFLETVPLHPVTTPAFLIARHETTIGDWIAFLDDLPADERERARPQGKKDLVAGFLDIRKNPSGSWEIQFQATDRLYKAEQGQRFRYVDRDQRASQDWFRFPVAGVSPKDALQYTAWLARSGRVPRARLCSEREWERAARGADGREFPHGNRLLHDDANFDLTYGRKSGGYGPDEVGSHPASVSPFGVHDLVGNVWDITSSALDKDQFVARGGSFYQNLRTNLSTNRDPISLVSRDHTIGLRVCADLPVAAKEP